MPESRLFVIGTEAGETAFLWLIWGRDFVVLQADGIADHSYRIGRLELPDSGLLTVVIAVAEVNRKLLVAAPEAVWHKTPGRRLLSERLSASPFSALLLLVA